MSEVRSHPKPQVKRAISPSSNAVTRNTQSETYSHNDAGKNMKTPRTRYSSYIAHNSRSSPIISKATGSSTISPTYPQAPVTDCMSTIGSDQTTKNATSEDNIVTKPVNSETNSVASMAKSELLSAAPSLTTRAPSIKESLKKDDAASSLIQVSSHPPSRSAVAMAVVFYLVTSVAMVILNKMVLNVFALPLTLLWIQFAFAAGILKLFELTRICAPFVPLSTKILLKLTPLVVINVIGLAMNTLCLQYLDASLYQVARALILPFAVIFSALFLKQKSSIPVLISCAIVSGGFLIGIFVEKDVHISMLGVIFGIVSSSTSAFHSIIIKKSLRIIDGAIALVYYNNLLSAILLFPLIFIETSGIIQLITATPGASSVATPWMFLIGSVLAVCPYLHNVV